MAGTFKIGWNYKNSVLLVVWLVVFSKEILNRRIIFIVKTLELLLLIIA